ncbi:hypothetical protein DPMN_045610 [Dreissena polymorpha]|uniref:Uncharacterized protein n=1 Tax=Dreissena polymorpha TaxID=45954 RepID=A0A9D4D6V1_DREPO|nr:hypothetical protein DPMN_045610 [Dreissena polymorpha]
MQQVITNGVDILLVVSEETKCGSSGLLVGHWLRDREVSGSNSALTTGISLSKKFIPHLLLSTQVYKWIPVREISQCAVAAYCAKMLTDDL